MEFYEDFSLDEATNTLFEIFKREIKIKNSLTEQKCDEQNQTDKTCENKQDKLYKLILDLDETLIYYQFNQDKEVISLRPFLREFLNECSQLYEIIVFTSSIKEYAEMIVNFIDCKSIQISQIHYRKQSQINTRDELLQSIIQTNDKLQKTVIIENSNKQIESYKENSICIKPWYGEKSDKTLKNLLPILLQIPQQNISDIQKFINSYKEKLIENIQKGSLNIQQYF